MPGALLSPLTVARTQGSGVLSSAPTAAGPLAFFGADVPRFAAAAQRLLLESARTNLIVGMAAPATQDVTVAAASHVLTFYGTGSIVLSGVATGTLNGTGADDRVELVFTPTAGTLTLTISGSVTRAQLEAGGLSTSYIEHPSTTALRGTDVASAPLAGLGIGGTGAGTYLLSGLYRANQSTLLSVSDGTNNNRLTLRANTAGTAFTLEGRIGAANITPVVQGGNAISAGAPWRVALMLPGDGTARCVGVAGSTAVIAGGPASGLTTLRIGTHEGGTSPLFGEIARAFVIPAAVPDATARALLTALPG
jgi:hypothetical protein